MTRAMVESGCGGGLGGAYQFPALSSAGASLVPPCSVSTPRSSNRTCGFLASGSPTGFTDRPTGTPDSVLFVGPYSSFRDRRTVGWVARPYGQSPGSWSLPQRTRSQVPSLHRHYPASTVLQTCPPPLGGPACPSRASGWERHRPTAGASRVACRFPFHTCHRPYPGGTGRAVSLVAQPAAAFPIGPVGRLPHCAFRGLLGVHSRYGLHVR